MDDVTRRERGSYGGESRAPRTSKAPPGMTARWLAALPGAACTAIIFGIAIARSIDADPATAAAGGGFMAVCCWAVLAPLAIAQRSGVAAWVSVGVALMVAMLLAMWT